MTEQQTIHLPDVTKFVMPAQHAVTILTALQNFAAPFKDVQPVITNFEQQLLAQQIRAAVQPAPSLEEAGSEPISGL